jgi:hypothetical protein
MGTQLIRSLGMVHVVKSSHTHIGDLTTARGQDQQPDNGAER